MKYLKYFLMFVLAGLLIFYFYFNNTKGEVVILDNNRDLGNISMGSGKKEIVFPLTNTSNFDIKFGISQTTCICTNAYLRDDSGNISKKIQMHNPVDLDVILKPGESYDLVAIFDPNAHGPDATGPISRNIYIQTDNKNQPKLDISFYGTVTK